MEELSYQLDLIQSFHSHSKACPHNPQTLLEAESPYHSILIPHFQKESETQKWSSTEYSQNKNFPQNLKHKCICGIFVRSKSEVIIANTLFTNNIPFRYESALELKTVTYFPDFTILNPHTSEVCYWEHFGLMDNSSYREKTYNKLKIYGNHNIIPSINLITTYETASHPIDSLQVQKIIEDFF